MFRRTFLKELFEIVKDRIAGKEPDYQGPTVLNMELETYTMRKVSGIFTDPFDGQKYRLTIEPCDE